MNTHRPRTRNASAALLAAAITLAGTSATAAERNRDKSQANAGNQANDASAAAARDAQKIQIASEDVGQRTAEHAAGQNVRGSAGSLIGEVADVIVDCQSGKIAFFVVSSGGVAGIGDTLRLVPYAAMSRATNHKGFVVSVTEAQWEKMPVINEQDFEAGRINLTADEQRELADARSNEYSIKDNNDSTARGDFGPRLARAAKLRGMDIQAHNQEIGEIEEIVLDLDRGTATALVEVDGDFVRGNNDFLVPLGRFQFTADRKALTTTLVATDFSSAGAGDRRATNPATVSASNRVNTDHRNADAIRSASERTTARNGNSAKDEPLSPTGRTDNTDRSRSVDPVLQSAARSIRQIWDAHPDLAKLDLRVTPENGRLIFRGTAPSVDVWERAKDTAESVVRGIEIENRISINDRPR